MPDDVDKTRAGAAKVRSKAMPSEVGASLFEGGQQAFTRWFQGMFALSQEIAQFTQNRVQEDMSAWAALAASRSPEEAMNCQRRFAERAIAQYTEEINRLSQMMVAIGGEGLSALEEKRRPAA